MQIIKMKQILLISIIWLFAVNTYAEINVLACEPEWRALVHELAGNQAKVYTATTNQQDPHHIQARPSLIAKARRTDLLICSGAELEVGWLPLLLRKSGNPNIQRGRQGYFMATDYVSLLDKAKELDRSHGDVHAAGNPHIQLDPDRLLLVAKALSESLSKIDPNNTEVYKNKLQIFTEQWQKSIKQWKVKASPLKGKSVVVHHRSWIYLQKWLGLSEIAALEPKAGIPPTSSHLSSLLSLMKNKPADMIIFSSYQDDKASKWLSNKTGIPTVSLDISPKVNESLFDWYEGLINKLLTLNP